MSCISSSAFNWSVCDCPNIAFIRTFPYFTIHRSIIKNPKKSTNRKLFFFLIAMKHKFYCYTRNIVWPVLPLLHRSREKSRLIHNRNKLIIKCKTSAARWRNITFLENKNKKIHSQQNLLSSIILQLQISVIINSKRWIVEMYIKFLLMNDEKSDPENDCSYRAHTLIQLFLVRNVAAPV